MDNQDSFVMDAVVALKELIDSPTLPAYVLEEKDGSDWLKHIHKPYRAFFTGLPEFVLYGMEEQISRELISHSPYFGITAQEEDLPEGHAPENYEQWYEHGTKAPVPAMMHSITVQEAEALAGYRDLSLDVMLASIEVLTEDYAARFTALYPDYETLPLQFRNRVSGISDNILTSVYSDVLKVGMMACQSGTPRDTFRAANSFVLGRSFWISQYDQGVQKCPLGMALNDLSSREISISESGQYSFTGKRYPGSFYAFWYERIDSKMCELKNNQKSEPCL